MNFNEKQLEILSVAGDLFGKKGFDGCSVRDIAKNAQVNVAMINYYFGSKERLLEDLFSLHVVQFKIDEQILLKDITALQMLDELIQQYIKQMNTNFAVYQVLAIEGAMKQRLLLSDAYKNLKEFNLNIFKQILAKGVEKGEFIAGNNPLLIHATIMGTFMNFQMNKDFMKTELNILNDESYKSYMETTLVLHLQKTIKALLLYEQ